MTEQGAAALAELREMTGISDSLDARREQGLCHSCRHSIANRRYTLDASRREGPPIVCGLWYPPYREGQSPDVTKCSAYTYEPGAAG